MRVVFLGNFQVDYSSETHHKKSLEALGHEVIALQEAVATAETIREEALQADMFVWVHTHGWRTPTMTGLQMDAVLQTLKAEGIPSVAYHLDLWFGLRRQADLERDPVYKYVEYFFTVDKKMADWFNENTEVKGRYLQAGVFHEECYYDPETLKTEQVIFVGSKGYHPEWDYRPKLIDWLRATYGRGFTHVGGDGDTGTIRGERLNNLYAHTKVAVGDSLCINFDYPYYWSDRVYETLGRGGFMIHPYIQGMGDHFENGKHLVFYDFNNFEQLKGLIDYYLEHEDEREAIRLAGHEHVKNNHTYVQRWQHIIEEVSRG